jgi:hypothetical protein
LNRPGAFPLRLSPLALHHIDSLQALLPLGDFEFDFISLSKNLETILFNGRKVHEQILPGFLGNKPKTFLLIEPFDSAFGHFFHLLSLLR